MLLAQCSIAVFKTFFLCIFKMFSLLSIQQIDNIFQLSIHTLVIIEMTSTVFKTDGKILFAMYKLKFYASFKLCMWDMINKRIKNTSSIKYHWHKDVIGLFLTNLTAYPRLQLVIDIKCFFFSDLVGISEHSGTRYVIFMFYGL